jgi:hypothetical protein
MAVEPLAARLRLPQYGWVAIALACLPVAVYQHRSARDMERRIDINATAEFRISHWSTRRVSAYSRPVRMGSG